MIDNINFQYIHFSWIIYVAVSISIRTLKNKSKKLFLKSLQTNIPASIRFWTQNLSLIEHSSNE